MSNSCSGFKTFAISSGYDCTSGRFPYSFSMAFRVSCPSPYSCFALLSCPPSYSMLLVTDVSRDFSSAQLANVFPSVFRASVAALAIPIHKVKR